MRFVHKLLLFLLLFFCFVHFYRTKNLAESKCLCKSEKTGKLHDFCYRHPENRSIIGKRFDCRFLDNWEPILDNQENEKTGNGPVFVTAFDQRYLRNGQRLISTLRKLGITSKIIVYNLGISAESLKIFENACNLEIRIFNFSKYSKSFKNLKTYRWKPIIISEVLKDFGKVWWLDASIILRKKDLSSVHKLTNCTKKWSWKSKLANSERNAMSDPIESGWNRTIWLENIKNCQKSQFLMHEFSSHSIIAATDPKVYQFIPTDLKKLENTRMYSALLIYIDRNRQIMEDVVKWVFLCALQDGCMDPEGARLNCAFQEDRFRKYAKCHRFDQSIMNLVLANQYGYDWNSWSSQVVDFFHVDRVTSPVNFTDFQCY